MKYNINTENIKKALLHPERAFDEVFLEYSSRLLLTYLNSVHTIGTNVYERDWDVLIILDTCRVDALKSVADEYEFITEVNTIPSVGGASGEWVARTFDKSHEEKIQNTAYLTANAHVKQILDTKTPENDSEKHLTYKTLRHMPSVDIDDLGYFEYLYQYERWGEEGSLGHLKGMTPPRYVTDRAIDVSRTMDYEYMILHYFQPHSPWVSNALAEDRELKRHEEDWWNYITETGDVETVWDTYLDELRYVLDDIELLLNNLEADTVAITADHGEAFGEYGILGHKIGSLHPRVRKVPWVETSGEDNNNYSPTIGAPEPEEEMSTESVEEQLDALGYKT